MDPVGWNVAEISVHRSSNQKSLLSDLMSEWVVGMRGHASDTLMRTYFVQADHSACSKPPVDIDFITSQVMAVGILLVENL